jgi:hypothetical protein
MTSSTVPAGVRYSCRETPRPHELRIKLGRATQDGTGRAIGHAVVNSPVRSFRPHMGIDYCNRTIDAAGTIQQVRILRSLSPVTVRVGKVTLVALTRNERSYSWSCIDSIQLR